MKKAFKRIVIALLVLIILYGIAQADNVNSHDITKELDRIKTQHDTGFVKEEAIDKGDLHYGWGLGEFYIQGYSNMSYDADHTPIFLMQGGDQIKLGFRLTQKIDALGGKTSYVINSDSNGFDSALGVPQTNFGKGCLIIQHTDNNNTISAPILYPDYLLAVSNNPSDGLVSILEEGSYNGALDYEVKFAGAVVIPGYNDYKIPFRFKILNVRDFYAAATTSPGITLAGTRTITIIVAVVLILAVFAILYFILRKRSAKSDRSIDPYGNNPSAADDDESTSSHSKHSLLQKTALSNILSKDSNGKLKSWQIICIFIIILALIVGIIGPILSKPTTYPSTIKYLDSKLTNANVIMAGSASAAFIITFLKDDFGTPVANELAKISGYMLLVVSALTLEKYLLTSIGFVAGIIIPIAAFILGVLWVLLHDENKKRIAAQYAIRLIIFGICIALIIPLGCLCGRGIEALNSEPLNKSIRDAEEANQIVEKLPDKEKDKSILEKALYGILEGLKERIEWASDKLNSFVQSVAVLLVTTIVIPILIVFAFILAIKFLTKKDFTDTLLGFSRKTSTKASGHIIDSSNKISNHFSKKNNK